MFERYRHLARLSMLEGEPGSGGGGGGEGNPPHRRSSTDVLQQYGGDAIRMADRVAELERENYRYREAKRDLTAENTALKATQTPDGALVLTGDAVKTYEALTALGKPEEIAAKLGEREALATEVATAKRDGTLRDVAEVAGFNPAVLKRLGGDLDYVIKETTQDGKAIKSAFVKTEQGERPLGDYVDEQWGDFKASLVAQGGGNWQQQGGGVGIPAQHSGNGLPPRNPAADYLHSAYKGPPQRGG